MFVFAVIVFSCRTMPTQGGGSMLFHFIVPYEAHVLLTFENSYNTRVATFVDTDENPGEYEVYIDGSLYPSGVYFIILDIKGSNNQDSTVTQNTIIFNP